MKSPLYFLIEPIDGKLYNDEKNGIVTTTSVEDHRFTQRLAKVIQIPSDYDGVVSIGDTVVVHHNTFRIQYNNQGVPLPSKYHIKDNLFFLEPELLYMVIKDNKREAIYPFCFVKPIVGEVEYEGVKEIENKGVLVYGNSDLSRQGFESGDVVFLKKDSEYEFEIFGEKLYMMKSNRILAKE